MDPLARNNVTQRGPDSGPALVFAHGFGCDQHMWRLVAPAFEDRYRTITYDHVGFGGSDLSAFDPVRHGSLQGYADDLLEVIGALGLDDVVFVGHSVAAMIGVRAAITDPSALRALALVCPSPRYIDAPGYTGGFSAEEIDGLLETLDSNYLGWSAAMAPVIMGNAERPELGEELTNSFCRTDPTIAESFARVTFLSDSRADLPAVEAPTLVIQTAHDAIAPEVVGRYVADHLPHSTFVQLTATGHCPNLSAPAETTAALDAFLSTIR
ncbi:alpha/beta fold hydrolase [Aquihabitans daechungensis]|uniref:alpha/beta fold hydrolase n=1 Tax=Aquihabitans daechungensis TaxID=1052257 RepID=UPI003B9E0D43